MKAAVTDGGQPASRPIKPRELAAGARITRRVHQYAVARPGDADVAAAFGAHPLCNREWIAAESPRRRVEWLCHEHAVRCGRRSRAAVQHVSRSIRGGGLNLQ